MTLRETLINRLTLAAYLLTDGKDVRDVVLSLCRCLEPVRVRLEDTERDGPAE